MQNILAKSRYHCLIVAGHATEYPGRCRLLASLEIAGDVTGEFQFSGKFTNRIHLEPVLLPFGHRRPE